MNAGDQFTFSLDQAVYHQGPVSMLVKTSEALTFEMQRVKVHKIIVTCPRPLARLPSMTAAETGSRFTIGVCCPGGDGLLS